MTIPLSGEATPLERALADVMDTRSRLRPYLGKVLRLTWDEVPNDWVPFAIQDEGLDELLPFIPPRMILSDEGRCWLRERGSSQAIARALGWYGQNAQLHFEPDEDENFDLFQVELSSPVRPEKLPEMLQLINLSRPTTDHLARIFSGFDARPFRLDHLRLDGPDLLDDWSGVRIPESGNVVVSFGAVDGDEMSFNPLVSAFAYHADTLGVVRIAEGFMLDQSHLDSEIVEPGVLEISVIQTAAITAETDTKSAPWPASSWPGYAWTDFAPEVTGGDLGHSSN
jgi:hypothetical protein